MHILIIVVQCMEPISPPCFLFLLLITFLLVKNMFHVSETSIQNMVPCAILPYCLNFATHCSEHTERDSLTMCCKTISSFAFTVRGDGSITHIEGILSEQLIQNMISHTSGVHIWDLQYRMEFSLIYCY